MSSKNDRNARSSSISIPSPRLQPRQARLEILLEPVQVRVALPEQADRFEYHLVFGLVTTRGEPLVQKLL